MPLIPDELAAFFESGVSVLAGSGEPAGENVTRMTLRNRGEPRDFSRLMAPFMAAAMRRATQKDLARLKSLLESLLRVTADVSAQ